MAARYKFKILRQRPIKGGRTHVGGGVEARIEAAIEKAMNKFHCSRSYVVAVALADAFGIPLDAKDRYDRRPEHVEPEKPSKPQPAEKEIRP